MTAINLARLPRAAAIGAIALIVPALAAAQAPAAAEWQYGSAVTLFGGLASPNSGLQGAAGVSIAWEFTPRLSFDATGLWFPAGAYRNGSFFGVGTRYGLMGARQAAPYVSASVGLYRSTYGMHGGGWMMGAMPWSYGVTSPYWPYAYGRPAASDFAIRAGGGVDLFAGRHVSIRPEVQVIVTTSRRDAQVIPLVGLHLAYHFEPHPITRKRR